MPRNTATIYTTLNILKEKWCQYPSLRLGQLIVNAAGGEDKLFYMEDSELIERIATYPSAPSATEKED